MLDVERRPDTSDAGPPAIRRYPASVWDGGCRARWCGRIHRRAVGSGLARASACAFPRSNSLHDLVAVDDRLARQERRSLRPVARFRAGRVSQPRPATTSRPLRFLGARGSEHGVGLARRLGAAPRKSSDAPAPPFLAGRQAGHQGGSSLCFVGGHVAPSRPNHAYRTKPAPELASGTGRSGNAS